MNDESTNQNRTAAVLDIGGTSIKSGIWRDGVLADVREHDTDAGKGGAFVVERAKEILRSYGEVEGIGISTAGQVDAEQGLIRYANSNIPGYTGMRIREIMEKEFQVPVAVENDVNAAALGEACCGAGFGFREFLCLTYGTGVGGAIVLDGAVYRGSTFSAGEMGAMIMHPKDRDAGRDMYSGCYEKYASTTTLVQNVMSFDKTLDNGRKIFEALDRKEVKEAVDSWIGEVAYGLVSLIHIMNPACVILGGGVMGQEYVLDRVRELVMDNIMESFRHVKITKARLGNQAGLYGAAQLIMRQMT